MTGWHGHIYPYISPTLYGPHVQAHIPYHTHIIYMNPLYVCMSSVPLIIVGGPIAHRPKTKDHIRGVRARQNAIDTDTDEGSGARRS